MVRKGGLEPRRFYPQISCGLKRLQNGSALTRRKREGGGFLSSSHLDSGILRPPSTFPRAYFFDIF